MTPRVLLADPHPVVLEGLRHIVENEGFHVIGLALDVSALLEAAGRLSPDLVILEASLTGPCGSRTVQAIRAVCPEIPIIFRSVDVATTGAENPPGGVAIRHVSTRAKVSDLVAALDALIPRDLRHLEEVATSGSAQATNSVNPARKLTPRQIEVLRLVAQGKTAKEVAAELRISARTAEFHKAGVMQTLGLNTTAELTKFAIEARLLQGKAFHHTSR